MAEPSNEDKRRILDLARGIRANVQLARERRIVRPLPLRLWRRAARAWRALLGRPLGEEVAALGVLLECLEDDAAEIVGILERAEVYF